MSERELGHGPAPLPAATAQLLVAFGRPGGCTQMNSRIMLLVFFLRVNQFFQGRLAVDAGDRSLTSHCGTLEGRLLLPLPFHPFRFCPLQDPVVANWNFSFMTVNVFFQVHFSHPGLTQLSGLGVGSEEVLIRAWGKRIFLFVIPRNCCSCNHSFYRIFLKIFFSNCSKLPTSLKDTRNGKKQQKSSKCVCLPWLESISLFSPGWPWTPPASASWAPWTATWCILPTLALHSKFLQFHLCVSVTEWGTLLLRSTSRCRRSLCLLPWSSFVFPFSLIPTFTFIENVFLLLPGTQIRSGDRWGRAALDDTFVPGTR